MEKPDVPDNYTTIDPIFVREIFTYVLNCLGVIPEMEWSGREFNHPLRENLEAIGETILTIQMILRDFLKRYFTSRAREIATDLQGAALDMINAINERWTGIQSDRVYIICALLMELYLFCGSMRIPVPDEFFPQLWLTKLAADFGQHVVLSGDTFLMGNPTLTTYYHDYLLLGDHIFQLSSPYESIPIQYIPEMETSYDRLVLTMFHIFEFRSIMNIEACPPLALQRIGEAFLELENNPVRAAAARRVDAGESAALPLGSGPRTRPIARVPAVGEGVPAVGEGVPAVGEGVPAVGEGVPAVGEGVPAVGEGVPAVGEGVPAVGEGVPAVGEGVPTLY